MSGNSLLLLGVLAIGGYYLVNKSKGTDTKSTYDSKKIYRDKSRTPIISNNSNDSNVMTVNPILIKSDMAAPNVIAKPTPPAPAVPVEVLPIVLEKNTEKIARKTRKADEKVIDVAVDKPGAPTVSIPSKLPINVRTPEQTPEQTPKQTATQTPAQAPERSPEPEPINYSAIY